jgi:hypothetical protein
VSLPVTITGNLFPFGAASVESNYTGPFKSDTGNFYGFFRDTTSSTVNAVKATDPTDSWSTQAQWALGSGDVNSVFVAQEGDIFHVLALRASETDDVLYRPYDASTDSWGTQEIVSANVGNIFSQSFIGLRSDGDVIALYPQPTVRIMGTDYARVSYGRREGGSWTSDIAVDDGGEVQYYLGCGAIDDADRTYFFYYAGSGPHIYKKDLTSANSLSSAVQVSDTALNTLSNELKTPAMGAKFYLDGSTKRVTVTWIRDDNFIGSSEIEDNGTPSAEEIVTDAAVYLQTIGLPSPSLALDGTDLYILYAKASDEDIYSNLNSNSGGWESDVIQLNAVTARQVSANVYDRSGTKIGYFYRDSTTLKYNEIVPGAAPSGAILFGIIRCGGVIPFR